MLRACIVCAAPSDQSRCPEHRTKKRNGSTSAWRKVRAKVIERDKGICSYCGDPGSNEVDHVVPLDAGGTDDMENLVCACGWCNRSKHEGGAPGRKPNHLRKWGAA
jgi:5-methylcytosine-specific restriction endonuclease McrA